jgi:uncharacterized protein YqjF (DUF2071 family)
MNAVSFNQTDTRFTHEPSDAGRERLLSQSGEPLFITAWERALMMHFEVDAMALRRDVPYELDLWNGRAFVSLVAFTMRGMSLRFGGRPAALLFQPVATHDFLNVRTYVRHGEPGIHFLAEWLSSRLAVMLGPPIFGLPYHHGKIHYHHNWESGDLHGTVEDAHGCGRLQYQAAFATAPTFSPCPAGSFAEWLMERYTAFNATGGCKRFFRVWHPPWPQTPADVSFLDKSLLTNHWPWFKDAKYIGANFSPGFETVWMGRPHCVKT